MEKREQIKTCRHFRFKVPQQLADELRLADPEPCEVCDPIMRRRGISFEDDTPRKQPIFRTDLN